MRSDRLGSAALAAAVLLGGCGTSAQQTATARAPVDHLLDALATNRPAEICGLLTPAAARTLRRTFAQRDCPAAARSAVRFVQEQPSGPRDYAAAHALDDPYVPLGPAPPRKGRSTAAFRVILRDPVVGQRQAIDLRVRHAAAGWQVDDGVAALFTVLSTP